MRPPGAVTIQLLSAAFFAAALAALFVGCNGTADGQDATGLTRMPGSELASNGAAGKKRFVLFVQMRMATVELPLGTVSGSEDIWSYLDEEAVRAVRSATMARNGMRVGLGRADAWEDVARILKKLTGREITHTFVRRLPNRPLPIVLKTDMPAQTIFVSHEDLTLSGADYPPGENLLTLTFGVDDDDPTTVLLAGVPQVRTLRRRTRFVKGPGGPRMVEKRTFFTFDEMAFRVAVQKGRFLVVGPNAASRRPSSVGHHFLIRRKEGVEFETMLVMFPQVVAAEMK